MANIVLFCVILLCCNAASSEEIIGKKKYFEKKHFQNLTDPINKVLSESNGSTEDLEKSLKWSPLVLYSTDLPLNNFTDFLVPVIKLVKILAPNHQLIVSLQYTKENRFLFRRIEDFYYDFSKNVSDADRSLIAAHLSAVVLDWSVENCYDSVTFYYKDSGKPNARSIKVPQQSFPKYVKIFLRHSLNLPYVPVGILYSYSPSPCLHLITDKTKDADFLVAMFTFTVSYWLRLDPDSFYQHMKKELSGYLNNNATLLIRVKEDASTNMNVEWYRWGNALTAIRALPFFQEMSLNFTSRLKNEKFLQFFTYQMLNFSYERDSDIIFGDYPGPVEMFGIPAQQYPIFQRRNIIPYLSTTEAQDDVCSMNKIVAEMKSKYQTVAVSIDAWRTFARYEETLKTLSCRSTDNGGVGNDYSPQLLNNTDVILYFDEDIWTIWEFLEQPIQSLLENHKTVTGMTVKTLLFFANDLVQGNDTILKFIESSFFNASTYKVGCVVSFDLLFREHDFANVENGIKNDSTAFRKIFDKVNVIVWRIEQGSFTYRKGLLPIYYQDVFLTREFFMREFPDKQIIIEPMESNEKRRNAIAFMFEAPVLLAMQKF